MAARNLLLSVAIVVTALAVTSMAAPEPVSNTPPATSTTLIGVDEDLGGIIPADIAFHDERGIRRTMGECVDRPTVLALVFYHCPGICGRIQSSLARLTGVTQAKAGPDYRILSVSFDPDEGTSLASENATNFLEAAGSTLPDGAWRFMTGSREDIRRICDAVGFRYVVNGPHNFTHPAVVTVLSKERKIVRYLYGTEFLPLDLEMALSEAARNVPGNSMRKAVAFCYSYDPESGRYVFNIFKVAGFTSLAVLLLFLAFLIRPRRRSPKESQQS